MIIVRWLRTRTALGTLAALWVGLLLVARFGAWDSARTGVTVALLVLGVISAIAFLQRWGETQDAVVERDVERARVADEVDKILEAEDKAARPQGAESPESPPDPR